MSIRENKFFSYSIIVLIYAISIFVGIVVYNALQLEPYISLLIADIASTIVVFIFSIMLSNASAYDPYWSVQPVVIGLLFGLEYGFNTFTIIMYITICVWGIRLTINWCIEFVNLTYQDWRYVYLKEKTKKVFPVINFVGIHLVPTLVVYTCLLPMVYAFIKQVEFNYFSLIFIAICLFAVLLQLVADTQMRKYRKSRPTPFMRTGVWKYSRHPNYLGEILMWWGIALSLICCAPKAWQLMLGAVLNTILFITTSIPLQDNRQSKKPGFEEYKKQTRALLPIYKKQN